MMPDHFALDSQGTLYPLAPRSWALLLERILAKVKEQLPASDDHLLELESILTALSHLPPREDTDLAKVRERQREKEIIKRRLAALVEGSEVDQDSSERSADRHQRQQGRSAQLRRIWKSCLTIRPIA